MSPSKKDTPFLIDNSELDSYAQVSFDLEKIISGIIKSIEQKIGEKPIKVLHKYASDLEKKYEGDEINVMKVIQDLLIKSLEMTEEGLIIVKASRGDEGINIRVRDTGKGLTMQEIQKLSDELKNIKSFAEKIGGNLAIESEVGLGSIFNLILPLSSSKVEEDQVDKSEFKFEHVSEWFGDDKEQLKSFIQLAISCAEEEITILKEQKPNTEQEISEIYHRLKPHLISMDLGNYYDSMPRPNEDDFQDRMEKRIIFLEDKIEGIRNYIESV